MAAPATVPINRARGGRCWRRRFMAVGAIASIAALVVAAIGVYLYQDASRSNVGELSFHNRLRIPTVLEPARDAEGRQVFDLDIAEGEAEFLDDTATATFGVNGSYLGPTLRVERGDEVVMNVTNRLAETTTLHWHGMHLPAEMDGGPHQRIAPGATWSPSWTVDQPAATLWYHAHPYGATGDQVYRGVAGMVLVDDSTPGGAGLPNRYGIDDIPLIIQDKRFEDDGQLNTDSPRFSPIGILGDEILVNGTYDPYLPLTTTRVRLRVLNASNSRTYNVGFTDDRAFSVIATDASLLAAPVEVHRLLLAPSERAELVVDVAPGDDVILRGYPTRIGGGSFPDRFAQRFAGGDDTFDLVRLVAADRLEPSPTLPERLPSPPSIEAPPDAVRRDFTFNHASRINGEAFDMEHANFTVEAGSIEVWELRNDSDNQHVFHVHGVSFSVIDYDGRSPPPEMAGLKDSVFLPPGTHAAIAVQLPDEETGSDAPYVFHCHVLAHEDHGMMGQYLVDSGG